MKVRYGYKPLLFGFLLFMFISNVYSTNNIPLQVEGLSSELQRNLYANLSTIITDEIDDDTHTQIKVDNVLRKGLRALGYYSPIIDFSLYRSTNGSHNLLVAHINPGQPVKVTRVHVILRGDACQDIDYQQMIARDKLPLGKVLNHSDYEKFKSNFSNLALRKGYFDADLRNSQLFVSPSLHQAFWNIDFNSGKRYLFGKVRFHGTQICEEYLQSLSNVHENDPYSTEMLAELNRRLVATNWFNAVLISTDFTYSKQSKVLPLDVIVTPRPRNSFEIGVGYTADVGPRVKITLNKPWLSARGLSLETSLRLSVPEQTADLSYKIPLLKKDPLEQYYLLQGGFKREYINNTQSNFTTILNIVRYWDWDNSNGWKTSFTLHWSLDHFTQVIGITNTTMLIYPSVNVNYIRQSNELIPLWGNSQRYSVDISNTTWGSNINFIILQMQNTRIRTIAKKHRFVARGNLGLIATNDFKCLPPSLRFFAGGDNNVRGYKYKSLSPHDKTGKSTGASKLAIGSLEYQYNITGKWWGAMFIDGGKAVNAIKQGNLKTGAGIGVRWQSPVGPIKLDFATPVTSYKHEYGSQFYIGLGPEI